MGSRIAQNQELLKIQYDEHKKMVDAKEVLIQLQQQ